MNRGDVVIVDFPCVTGSLGKKRPAVVIQNDQDNRRLTNTIVAMITGNPKRASEPTHLPLDPSAPEGAGTGLHKPSLVNCTVLPGYTVQQKDVLAIVGRLSLIQMQSLNACLRHSLQL